MIRKILEENYESEITKILINIYKNKVELSGADIIELKKYETEDYALLGITGLIINSKARILLGKKQPYEPEIRRMCEEVEIPFSVLEEIARKYLDDDYSEEQEVVLRKVMLEYPKNDVIN